MSALSARYEAYLAAELSLKFSLTDNGWEALRSLESLMRRESWTGFCGGEA